MKSMNAEIGGGHDLEALVTPLRVCIEKLDKLIKKKHDLMMKDENKARSEDEAKEFKAGIESLKKQQEDAEKELIKLPLQFKNESYDDQRNIILPGVLINLLIRVSRILKEY